jgi:hypothetical protein
MADAQDAGKLAKELLDVIKSLSVQQLDIVELLRDVMTKALPALHAEQRDMNEQQRHMSSVMEQFHAQMVKLTALVETRYGNERTH